MKILNRTENDDVILPRLSQSKIGASPGRRRHAWGFYIGSDRLNGKIAQLKQDKPFLKQLEIHLLSLSCPEIQSHFCPVYHGNPASNVFVNQVAVSRSADLTFPG